MNYSDQNEWKMLRKTNSCVRFQLFLFAVIAAAGAGCSAQENDKGESPKRIGGPFENAEYFYYGMEPDPDAIDTSPGWSEDKPKLVVTGTIYQRDGKTPAPGIILYYYHTDVNGLYSEGPGMDQRARRHGYLRGWVKSDASGNYTIRTIRPAPYPGEKIPAHIHLAIKEPELNEYYIDDLVFEDDPLLTAELKLEMENRGGSGILRPVKSGDTETAEHDVILGLNIPDHPAGQDVENNPSNHDGENLPR